MAFDPTNASVISNVVAGTGVTITHSQVSGVDTFTADIDQTWLATYLATNVGGSLPLSTADEARLAAVEAAVGITSSSSTTTTPATSGTTGTTTIAPSMTNSSLAVDATITYELFGIDGTGIASETLFISSGSSASAIAWGLYANIQKNATMSKYIQSLSVSSSVLTVEWKTANVGSTFTVTVDSSDAGDGVGFTVTDY